MSVFLEESVCNECFICSSARSLPAVPAAQFRCFRCLALLGLTFLSILCRGQQSSFNTAAGPPINGSSAPAGSSAVAPSAGGSSQVKSLFDSLGASVQPVTVTVQVRGTSGDIETTSPRPFEAGAEQVINSAGTYGDISRYLQLFPGVVAPSDLSNQILVRGGHPMENLFLVDDIEVPNINHLADANTTGGLGPMIDAAAIQGLSLYTGGYDARYPERLSSVTEIRTLDGDGMTSHLEGDLGIQGLGGMTSGKLLGGNLLASLHHGLLNLVSGDTGMNGVPSYTNELTRFRRRNSRGDRWTVLNLAGWDSIDIVPCASDTAETSTIDSQYRGRRETSGGQWQHIYSKSSFGVFQLSDSEQIEHIHQQDQIENPLDASNPKAGCPLPAGAIQAIPVYQEDSNDAFTTAGYRFEWANSRSEMMLGSAFWLQRPHFNVQQPTGAFSPYSASPVRADSTSFASDFSTGESGTFAQFWLHPLPGFSVSAGARLQTFALGAHTTLTPRLSARYSFGEKSDFHVAYATYAQMPPYAYLLAYAQNRSLAPMRVTHEVAGMSLTLHPALQIQVEAYNKTYHSTPASSEYPAVTMHTMVDMVGEQIVWLPMRSAGQGAASGIELSDSSRFGAKLQLQGSLAYSRAKFAGTDGVLRPSNFDFPWIANLEGIECFGRNYTISARYGYATGRPYTPFNLPASLAQNRPIYDLSQVNTQRAPYYQRVDAQINRQITLYKQHLELYGGVDNILNRSNFLSYAWMPRWGINSSQRNPVTTLWQTPIFPNFGVRLIVH